MNNNTFNILNQLVQEQKSLWRIEHHYIQESQTDEERLVFEELKKQKQEIIEKLSLLVGVK